MMVEVELIYVCAYIKSDSVIGMGLEKDILFTPLSNDMLIGTTVTWKL